jgi:AraC family transcriptional activator of mtrCDE
VLTALSQVLLAMGLRAHASDPHGALGLVGALQDPRLGRSLQAMLADPAHPWSVDELAALAAMSRATYFRHFRQRLGCSVWDFMVRVRMVRAAELLRHPDQLPLGEVAQRVGYQSEASFAKAFKQSSGMAPGRFRQQGWPALPG